MSDADRASREKERRKAAESAPSMGSNSHDEDAAADDTVQDNLDRLGIQRKDQDPSGS